MFTHRDAMKPLCALAFVLLISTLCVAQHFASETLQRRADEAHGAECAQLSMQVARHSLEDAHHLFSSGNSHAAHGRMDLVLHYAARAVECTVESRKRQKPTEIELRSLIRRMREVARTVDTEDRAHLKETVDQLEAERDKLLQAIFGPAGWKATSP